jgi:Kef-type K+ transport system membrane component KefB
MPSVGLFGLLIVLVYVAQTGAEIDRRVFDVRGVKPVLIVAGSTAIAVISGFIIQGSFNDLVPRHVSSVAFALFVAAALLITAVPVLARILDETGLTRTYIGGWALAIAVYVDFVAFTIAAVATPLAKAHITPSVLEGPGVLLATLVLSLWLAPAIARVEPKERRIALEMALLAGALAAASATNASTLVAAFIVGAIVWRRGSEGDNESKPMTSLVRALVPVYIVYSGLQVNLRALTHSNLLLAAAVVLVLAIVGKLLASLLAARLLGFERYQTRMLAVLGNTRGLTELILISLGHTAGILSTDAYSILFLMTLVTTAASGALARLAVRDSARARSAPVPGGAVATGKLDA